MENISGHLRFADDIVLFANSTEDLKKKYSRIDHRKLCLHNYMFTKNNRDVDIRIEKEVIRHINNYVYLGQQDPTNHSMEDEIRRIIRIASIWTGQFRIQSNVSMALKKGV